MKTYKEMAESALLRISARKEEIKTRNLQILLTVPASLMLSAVLAVTVYYGIEGNNGTINFHFFPGQYAAINDYCDTFSELESTARYVIRAKAISSDIKVGQQTLMEVIDLYKGVVPETVLLDQLLTENPAIVGCEYVIFMNKQAGADNENEYYPVSGGSGIMRIDEEQSLIYIQQEKLIDEAMMNWLESNLPGFEPVYRHYEIEAN